MRTVRTHFNRFIIALLSLCLLVNITGCDELMDSFTIEDIEVFVNESFTQFLSNPSQTDLNSLSRKKYETSLSDEQLDVFYYSLRHVSFEITGTEVGSSRESGKCTVEFLNVPDISRLDQTAGTFDELKASIDKLDTTTVKIKFKLVQDGGQWLFKDISDFWDANPLTKNTIETPTALINVLYFNKPMNLDLSYKLFFGGEKIYSGDITVINRVVAEVQLDSMVVTGNSKYQQGEYKIEYYIGEEMIAESPVIVVK